MSMLPCNCVKAYVVTHHCFGDMSLSQPWQLDNPRPIWPLKARLVFSEVGGGFVDAHWAADVGEVGTGVDEIVLAGCVKGLAVALLVLCDPRECHVDPTSLLDGAGRHVLLETAIGRVTGQICISCNTTLQLISREFNVSFIYLHMICI